MIGEISDTGQSLLKQREALIAWADNQPDTVKSYANVVSGNLRHLAKEPADEMLHAQTKINIARLASVKRKAIRVMDDKRQI